MNMLISGTTGSGKSFYYENSVHPKISMSSFLILDPKGQYRKLVKKEKGWVSLSTTNIEKLLFALKTAITMKKKFGLILEDDFPDANKFNTLSEAVYQTGNCYFIVEESHLYLENKWHVPKYFDRLMRMGTGAHNRNIDVILITQFPQDIPKPVFGNIKRHYMFKLPDKIIDELISKSYIMGKKPVYLETEAIYPKGYVGQGYRVY